MDNKEEWQDINDSHKNGEVWIVQNGAEGGFYTEPYDVGIAEWVDDAFRGPDWYAPNCCDGVTTFNPVRCMLMPKGVSHE